jgi:hypothetical protein
MKRLLPLLAAMVMALAASAQVPQFSSEDFAGWIYTNPAIPLNQSSILNNRIVLYTTSTGLQLTLTSPDFSCFGGQVINMRVTWITDQWRDSGFDVNKVALTAALLDANGVAVDSVTAIPVNVSRTNYLNMSITVPRGMTSAALRFASWKANVNNCGAVREIAITSVLKGDVNLDGEITIADINAIIQVILGGQVSDDLRGRADVNEDKEVTVADINSVIDLIV